MQRAKHIDGIHPRPFSISLCGWVGVTLLTGAATAHAEEARGPFVFGHEVRTVRSCRDVGTLGAHVSGPVQERLRAENDRLPTQMYLDFDGGVGRPLTGFAAHYDGIIEVRELRPITRAGYDPCTATAGGEVGRPAADQTAKEAAKTYVFVCPDQTEYVVRTTGTEAWVFRSDGTLRLPAAAGSGGSAYSDGSFELWIEGEEARLGIGASEPQACRNDARRAIWERAKLDGIDFRAAGNEPGWVLEIRQESRVALVTDNGATRVELPLPPPREEQDARRTRWNAGELQIEVIGHPCNDSMSGERFQSEVIVTWQGRTLRGCGRALH